MVINLIEVVSFCFSSKCSVNLIFQKVIYKTTEDLRMEGVLDSIELQILRRIEYMRERKILAESHVQSYVTPSVLLWGGFWAGRKYTLLSIRNSMESKSPFIRKYLVVL